jgi:hypothetical protein
MPQHRCRNSKRITAQAQLCTLHHAPKARVTASPEAGHGACDAATPDQCTHPPSCYLRRSSRAPTQAKTPAHTAAVSRQAHSAQSPAQTTSHPQRAQPLAPCPRAAAAVTAGAVMARRLAHGGKTSSRAQQAMLPLQPVLARCSQLPRCA